MTGFDAASHIVRTLRHAGHTAYFAGGWVRDYLLKHPSDDIDLATDAPPERVAELFPHTIAVGAAFGVVIVVIDNKPFEVSSFRKDGLYLYGRRPESIEYASAEEDAQRRDFTINGMFYDPLTSTILDFVGGQEDLKKGIVKAIGEPIERFREDRLRMIRAVRIMARFNFKIDPPTRDAIATHALTLFPAVAVERVWQEFNKMAAYAGFDRALVEMHALGLLQQIFPSLESTDTSTIARRTAEFSKFPKKCPTILYLIQLFPHANAEQLEILEKLKIPASDFKLIAHYLNLKRLAKADFDVPPVELVYFFAHADTPLCLQVYQSTLDNTSAFFEERVRLLQQALSVSILRVQQGKPLVRAADLQNHGIVPGKGMGALLKEAERLSIEEQLDSVPEIIERLKTTSHWPQELK